jgi:carboxymethylenebutenolidase
VLVVLQEIFGVNSNIRQLVNDFAAQGFVAVAPDLFWRQQRDVQLNPGSVEDRARATALMKDLNADEAVTDAKDALACARSLSPKSKWTAAVGYCLGGKISYLLAARGGVDLAVSYYGVGIQSSLSEAQAIRGRILLHMAGDDHLCPPEAQAKIAQAVAPLGARAHVLTYPGVGHAFARRGGDGFNAEATSAADAATADFLASPTSAAV